MTAACENANWALARLMGWTGARFVGGSLVGCPPAGAPACRSEALAPDWCGSWDACGPLMVEHGCYPALDPANKNRIVVQFGPGPTDFGYVFVSEYPTRGHAVRAAVVWAVFEKLMRERPVSAEAASRLFRERAAA